MRIGFTGTQEGMTDEQAETLRQLLRVLPFKQANHGDCVGADAQFHSIVRTVKPAAKIWIHPPDRNGKRAHCDGDIILIPKPYLDRNKDIVDAAEQGMFATPKSKKHETRSGTWATIRYCRKIRRNLTIIWPDGTTRTENYE